MNRDMLGHATLNNATGRQVSGHTQRPAPGSQFPSAAIPTHLSRGGHVTVTLDGASSLRALLQQHAQQQQSESSLLRHQLNKSPMTPPAAKPPPQQFVPENSLLAQHLTQPTGGSEPQTVELAPSDKVRVLKTSGGTVTVRSLSPVSTSPAGRTQLDQRKVVRSIEQVPVVPTFQRRVVATFPAVTPNNVSVAVPRKILPKPVHSLTFLANNGRPVLNKPVVSVKEVMTKMNYGGDGSAPASPIDLLVQGSAFLPNGSGRLLQNKPAVAVQGAAPHAKYVDSCARASPSDVPGGLKNMAVVHPQVRPAMSARPVGAEESAKDVQLSKVTIQNMAASVAQKLGRVGAVEVEAATPQRLEPNMPIPVSIQRSIPVQRSDESEARRSKMILVDLTEGVEPPPATVARQGAPLTPSEARTLATPSPVVVEQQPIPLEAGCLQVPSGLKVDFINLDDLLIGDLNYLARYFGLSILEPLTMDDIAHKGLSEWIDISDDAEVEKTFTDLKALNGSQQLCWSNQMAPESPDVAYPIIVPEYEELESTSSTLLPGDTVPPTATRASAAPVGGAEGGGERTPPATANHSPRVTKESPVKSPLILIIKKGANSSASSPAWQLSPCRRTGGGGGAKDAEESKTMFCTALNLLPSSGEQLRKMRKGKSARALAVLKDKVMSEYLKNHYVPLHRVQGMYRYLFKKGHLREGKLTYACEVYRNLRSRENRPRASLVISRYDEEDFVPKKSQTSSPGLLWHLKAKKPSSKYETDEDYVPRRSQVGGSQKLRRSLWGRPRNSWRTANASSTTEGRCGANTPTAAPLYYKLEAGNWMPKCTADHPTGQWEDIWVSENSLESKMSRPIPMVVLTRLEDCPSEKGASEEVSPPRSTQVSELFCSQCSYSCLNKPSLMNHFSARHEGADFSFKTVVLKCRVGKTAKSDASST